jgi:hypothetical protein
MIDLERVKAQNRAKDAVALALLNKLENIKIEELGASPIWPRKHSHPAVMLVASVSHSGEMDVLKLDSPSNVPDIQEQNLMAVLQRDLRGLRLSKEAWKAWEPYGRRGIVAFDDSPAARLHRTARYRRSRG